MGMKQHLPSVYTPEEATVRARLVVKEESAEWLLLTMARFKAGVQRALDVAKRGKTKFTTESLVLQGGDEVRILDKVKS